MPKDYAKIANKYAQDVLNGTVLACKFVKMACQRHIADMQRADHCPFVFNPLITDTDGKKYRPGDRVCSFLELLRHVKGKWRGKQFILAPWQVFIVCVGFGWVRKDDGTRRFREMYLEVPRKNGKSFLSAGIGLYMFAVDGEPGSEVYVGANGEHQANKVFAPAWQMVAQEPDLRRHYSIQIYGQTPESGRLGTNTDYSKMERLIGNPKDGDMPSCYLCDEFHEHDTPHQYDTMRTGMGSRRQPMIVITTTAGISKDGPCYEKRGQCLNVLKGTFENDELFAAIYTIDDGDDWHDLDTWKKANPNLGISFFEPYILTQLKEAEQNASKEAIIKCKNLDIWLDSYNSWLDMDLWRKAEDEALVERDFIGKYPCFEGDDLGAVSDLCARVKVYVVEDMFYVFSRFYLPRLVAENPDKTNYLSWTRQGFIETFEGRSVDFDAIGDQVFDDIVGNPRFKEFALDVGFAAWSFFQRLQKRLEKRKGKEATARMLIEYGKTVKNFSEPMKQLEKALLDGKLRHDGNPVLSWCMGNVVVKIDKKENIFATKERDSEKIDGADALITAFARAMMFDPKTDYVPNDGSCL
jgi:phage terminase large subunit-like protein